jgi:hypothetical protein
LDVADFRTWQDQQYTLALDAATDEEWRDASATRDHFEAFDELIFWRWTPEQLAHRIALFHQREEREWTRIATLGAWILQSWGSKATPAKLLGKVEDV